MPESILDQGIQVNKEPDSSLAELDLPVKEEPTKEKPEIASKVQPLEETGAQKPVSVNDAFPEGEEGWQTVHRPRSAANYVDYHTAKAPSANHKFGQKVVKALTYRDKSVPSSAKESTKESGRDESNSSLEVSPVQTIGPTQEHFYKPFFESVAKALLPGGV
ncbi:hypothetical protein Tco_1540510 [Tanacetum coccineum]